MTIKNYAEAVADGIKPRTFRLHEVQNSDGKGRPIDSVGDVVDLIVIRQTTTEVYGIDHRNWSYICLLSDEVT